MISISTRTRSPSGSTVGNSSDLDSEHPNRRAIEQADGAREEGGHVVGFLSAPRMNADDRRDQDHATAAIAAATTCADRSRDGSLRGSHKDRIARAGPGLVATPPGRIGGSGRSRTVCSQMSPQCPCVNARPKLFASGPKRFDRFLERADVFPDHFERRVEIAQSGIEIGSSRTQETGKFAASLSDPRTKVAQRIASRGPVLQQLGTRIEDPTESFRPGAKRLEDLAAGADELFEIGVPFLQSFRRLRQPSRARPRLPSGSSVRSPSSRARR